MKTANVPLPFRTALALACLCGGLLSMRGQTLENLWEIVAPSPDGNLDTGNLTRGLTYNALSNQVIVATRSGGNKCVLYDADTGTLQGYMNMSGVSGGSVFTWNLVACADDGVLYGFNVSATTFKIYRWDATDTNLAPTVAYGPGDPANGLVLPGARWGDAVAIRGAGTNTEILVSSFQNTNAILFRTADGTNFSPIRIDISGIADNDLRNGLAFYTNNTFWAQRVGRPLFLIRYGIVDSLSATGQVLASFSSALSPLACVPEARLLAGIAATTPGQLRLFDIASLPPTQLAQTNFLASFVNGNLTGAAAFGGPGRTNRLYALWSNNGIKAAAINWTPPPAPPTITGQPAGGTVYTNMSSFTFTVAAAGSPPPTYQWLFNGAPIPGATASTYIKPGPFTLADAGNYSAIVSNSSGVVTSAPAALVVLEAEQTAFMTRIWAVTNGTRSYLQNDNASRGMDYDPVTGNLVIVSRTGNTNAIYALSSTNGADLFLLNTAGITSGGGNGTFGLNLVGVADDGAVYAGNLTINNADGNFILYRWDSVSPAAVPAYAFVDNPVPGENLRWGDSLAVRGAGTSTEILIGSASVSGGSAGLYVALLTTGDGFNFVSHPLVAPPGVPADFARLGIAFGAGNTFWTKSGAFRLRHFAYDPTFTSNTLTLLGEYALPSRLLPATGIAVETNLNLLAAVEVGNPDNLQLYRLPTTTNPPVLLDQEFFPTDNPNGNATAAVAFGTNNTLYALDSNNGLLALSLNPAAALPELRFTRIAITNAPAPGALLTWRALVGGAYQLQFKGALSDATWTDLGPIQIANNLTLTLSDTDSGFTNRFYRAVRLP